MKKKDFIVFFILCCLVFLASIHEKYIGTGVRSNFFLFYEYCDSTGVSGRFLSNILHDLSGLTTISSLLFISFYISDRKALKRVLLPFFIISIADILDYVLFFQRYSYVKIFFLIIMIFYMIYPMFLNKRK